MTTQELIIGQMKLIQDEGLLKIGVDSILLAAFARLKKSDKVLELGCGSGVIELLLAARRPEVELDAVELDSKAYDLACRNMRLNRIGPNIRIHRRNLKELDDFSSSYTLVLANPPYRKMGSGALPQNPSMLRALFESDCTIEDVSRAAAARLKTGGRFCVVYKPERLCDLFCAMRESSLEPKRMVLVRHTAGHRPSLVLVEAVKGAASGLRLGPALTLKSKNGAETKKYQAVYKGGSL
jgi:tRNA1Val (adenine37-N6)-methyltransferase